MNNREVMQQALEALENGKRVRAGEGGTKYQIPLEDNAITALKAALAEPQEMRVPMIGACQACGHEHEFPQRQPQEPVAWSPALDYPGYVEQRVWANGAPRQEDIDYWDKQGLGITYAYTHPAPHPQVERNFCSRCGKRLSDGVHTCTPPDGGQDDQSV